MSKAPTYFCDGCEQPHEYGKHTTRPTNSIDSELEEIFNVMYSAFELNGVFDEATAIQAISAKYISRQKVEEALEALITRITYNAHDMGEMGIFVRTKYAENFIDELRAKLLPPTKGDTNDTTRKD